MSNFLERLFHPDLTGDDSLLKFLSTFHKQWGDFMKEFDDLKTLVGTFSGTIDGVVKNFEDTLAKLQGFVDAPTPADVQAIIDVLTGEKAKLDALATPPAPAPPTAAG